MASLLLFWLDGASQSIAVNRV